VKRPQVLTVAVAVLLVVILFFWGRTVPTKKAGSHPATEGIQAAGDSAISIDTFLTLAKQKLSTEQVVRINTLEHSISRGDVKQQQIKVYRQLAKFWYDTANAFEPYAWYEAEAARLENSEKSLNFAARLFLENLQSDDVVERRKWKALQAKDLFERALAINPSNDSSKVGLGACYLFGNLSAMPMEGILKIREVVERDSNNMYAQMMLAKASAMSGQFDKAIGRLRTIVQHEPDNIESILMLADLYDRTGDKKNAVSWYEVCLTRVKQPEAKSALQQRIAELKK
jgi:tetratricopeptide (TPR) repeat protein